MSMNKKQAQISIVVPAHNAASTLAACLQALLKQRLDEPYEIIVVDDGSHDRTPCLASLSQPTVKLLSQPHKGAAAARNRGFMSACGEIILFTDADCEPVPDWAAALVRAIRAGAAGAKGTYRTRQKSLTARFVQAEYESKYRRMARLPKIDFIDTYSAAYRRAALLEVGGFNESLPFNEDQELSFRLAERGYDLRFVPEAVVYHTHAHTPQAYIRKKFWIGYWKVKVAALHPDRIWSDSHTPPSIKAQMLLLAAGVLATLLSPFAPVSSLAKKGAMLSGLGFLASTLPFAASLVRRDPPVALATPWMMLLRAVGLLCGSVLGLGRSGRQLARQAGYQAAKRAVDVALAALGLAITAPFMPFIAAAIQLDSSGPAIFVQWRAGRNGKPFRMYKFRTMVDGAEGMRAGMASAQGLEEPVLKFRDDPRITRVGRFLRRWSLDELPQFVNVLRGEMSLVGPRPEELYVVDMYSPRHRQRLRATPGVTGPMQVSGRADLTLEERVRIEVGYINRASLLEDAGILVKTVQAVLSGNGSY